MTTYRYFCPCPRGLEATLVQELAELGIPGAKAVAGGVGFEGDWRVGLRVNLHSRIASRVLLKLTERPYRNENDLYAFARDTDWSAWFAPECTLRVDVTAIRAPLKSLEFTTLRIKDAICDRFRDESGIRPSIDTRTPQVRVSAFLTDRQCTLYLDTSGEPLFKRGWRLEKGEAPLRENLAAGLLRLSGWRPEQPLLDPMCGSGTILIEAAQIALGIAPGANRRFGFENLKRHDPGVWEAMLEEARDAESVKPNIAGSDVSGDMLELTRNNMKRAGIGASLIALKQVEARGIQPNGPDGILIANPPYGERIGFRAALDSETFYADFGATLKKNFAGWRAFLFTADLEAPRGMRLQPSRKILLYNGAIECRLFEFRMVQGTNRPQRQPA